MNITLFAKKRTTKDGKKFYVYLTTLTRKDGSTLTTAVKFSEGCDVPRAEDCPLNIVVDKSKVNLSTRTIVNPESGEPFESHTLWVKEWTKSTEKWIDHSMDDFE